MKITPVTDILSLILPNHCRVCGHLTEEGRKYICFECERTLPRESRRNGTRSRMENRIASVQSMREAQAWITYHPHGPSGRLIHAIKYHGCRELARRLGAQAALEMLTGDFLHGVDVIVPIPIHFTRRLKRGYNQSEEIARGIGNVLRVPVVKALSCSRHKSQTRLGDTQRRDNVEGIYRVNRHGSRLHSNGAAPLEIMLVDDVCTSGSTLISAARAIEESIPEVRIRLFALALTFRT